MYLGDNSIFSLRAFLNGASWGNNISNPSLMNDF